MEKNNKWRQTMKTQNIKGKLLSNQIATRNTKEKKSWAGWACTKTGCERSCYEFSCAFRGISRSVQGPLVIIISAKIQLLIYFSNSLTV